MKLKTGEVVLVGIAHKQGRVGPLDLRVVVPASDANLAAGKQAAEAANAAEESKVDAELAPVYQVGGAH
jgi:hypothetical protein